MLAEVLVLRTRTRHAVEATIPLEAQEETAPPQGQVSGSIVLSKQCARLKSETTYLLGRSSLVYLHLWLP